MSMLYHDLVNKKQISRIQFCYYFFSIDKNLEDNIGQANETIIYAFEDVSIKSVGYNEKLLHNLGLIYASPATVAWPPCTSRPIFAFYCSNKNYRKSVELLLYQFKHLLSCSISATVTRHPVNFKGFSIHHWHFVNCCLM